MRILFFRTIFASVSSLLLPLGAQATLVGPTPFLSFADSPFAGGIFNYFDLETFQDEPLNTPGISGSGATSSGFSGSIIGSADTDDGLLKEQCPGCDSFFGTGTVAFTFESRGLSGLPKYAGVIGTGTDADPLGVTAPTQ